MEDAEDCWEGIGGVGKEERDEVDESAGVGVGGPAGMTEMLGNASLACRNCKACL